jgi:iron complex outermembrane receptor protein
MSKKNLIILVLFSYFHGFTQNNLGDTINKTTSLKEVIICESENNKINEAFNFYRSSKLASTEDILQRIEGVNLIRRGAFGMEPTLRTYSAGQINITLNGMKMYGACTDKMDPVTTYVEPNNLSKIEVNQGAAGGLLGSTIGGSLNMQLKEATFNCKDHPQLNFYTQFSTVNNAKNIGFNVNTNSNKLALRISGAYRKANDYNAGGGVTVLHSGYEKLNLNFSVAYQLNKTNHIVFDYINDNGFNIGYPALPMDVSFAKANIFSVTHRFVAKNLKHVLETKFYHNNISHAMDDTHRPETIMHMDMPGWSYTNGFYSQYKIQSKKQLLNLRIDAHQAFTKAEMTMYPTNEKPMFMQTLPGNFLNNTGLAANYLLNIDSVKCIGFNIREDYNYQYITDEFGILQWQGFGVNTNEVKQNFLTTSSLFLQFNKGVFTNKFTVGYGQRLPTGNERIGFYLFNRADGFDYIGNYNLAPEKALQFEFSNSIDKKKWSLNSTLFYHQIADYIYGYILKDYSPMTIGGRGVKTYANLNNAQLLGFETAASIKLFKKIMYKGNVRFTYGFLSNGQMMQQVPPLKMVNTLRYQMKIFQFQLEHVLALSQNNINMDFGESKTSNWQIVNARIAVAKSIKTSIFQVSFGIENMFDLNYREHLDWGGVPQFGRNISVGVNYYLN